MTVNTQEIVERQAHAQLASERYNAAAAMFRPAASPPVHKVWGYLAFALVLAGGAVLGAMLGIPAGKALAGMWPVLTKVEGETAAPAEETEPVEIVRNCIGLSAIAGAALTALLYEMHSRLKTAIYYQRQSLLAALDGAINTSPFLTNEQRMQILLGYKFEKLESEE